MSSFVIGACSTSDLPKEYTDKHNILILKYTFTIDNKEYKDGDMDTKTFFDMERDGHLPTTSLLTPDYITEEVEKILIAGNDLLYIAFSSGLSGSCNNVMLVAREMSKKYPERKFIVIDSLCASLGHGLLLDYAVKMRDQGKSIDEVAKWVESNKLSINHWFTVDSLSHLRRGGRVTGAAAFVGSLLHIKPVLNVDFKGHLIPREKEKGRKRALKCLVGKMEELVVNPDGQTIFISHGDDDKAANYVANLIKETFPKIGDIMLSPLGAVIGAHAGPGTIALFFKGKPR